MPGKAASEVPSQKTGLLPSSESLDIRPGRNVRLGDRIRPRETGRPGKQAGYGIYFAVPLHFFSPPFPLLISVDLATDAFLFGPRELVPEGVHMRRNPIYDD